MHVVVKNLQSVRGESRWEDFFAELNTCHFDVLVICEHGVGKGIGLSSRKKVSTSILAVVPLIRALEFDGICISANFASEISHRSFHVYSRRICSLHFCMASRRVRVFSVYLRTAWDADGEVEQMYDVLNLLVNVLRLGTYRSWAEISMLALGR